MARRNMKSEWGYDSTALENELKGQPYVDGFGLTSILGGLFVAFIMLPATIYLSLVAGMSMGTAAQWTTIILFTEIARRAFKTLNKQQIYVLFSLLGGVVVAGGPFFALIWNQYFVQSSYAKQFNLTDEMNLPQNDWIAPAVGSEALVERTFLHPDWIPAIIVIVLVLLMDRIIRFSLGYLLFRVTTDVEKLPFPLAPIAAEGATALAEAYEPGQRWRWRVFSTGAAIGLSFGAIYIVIPTLTGAIMANPIQLLPIPWIDLCTTFENILPAASIGITTDIGALFFGFVLPFSLVVGQFVGAILAYVIVNPILHQAGVLTNWSYGMETIQTTLVNDLDFWLSFKIGAALLIASLGVLKAGQVLIRAKGGEGGLKALLKPPEGRGDFPIWIAVTIWFVTTGGFVYLCHRCVPDFPWWIFALFGFVWTPLNSYISARMMGLAAQTVSIPFLKEGSFIMATRMLSYQGSAIWFAPIPLFDHGWTAQWFREMTLTRTKITSIIKVELTVFPIMLVAGILFMGLLWKIAPIPSASYPFVARIWPLEVQMRCLWATATSTGESYFLNSITIPKIATGYGVALGLFSLLAAIKAPPLFFYGMIGGVNSGMPHGVFLLFLGGLLGRYVFAKRFGEERWRKFTPVLAAGFASGMGVAAMFSIGVAMIAKSVIELPY